MLKEVKCRICSVKSLVILSGLLLIAVCAFAQAPEWEWATQAGGTGYDYGNGIALDDAENSYVTGYFFGAAIFGSCSLTSRGGSDIFVAKMDADGTWQWAAQAGGNDYDHGEAITTDDEGNCYVTGYFEGTATFGSYSLTSSGSYDIFVAKMDASGNWLWVTQAGGVSRDEGYGITIDDNGNSYVTGYFYGTATFGLYSLTSSGYSDIFVAKMDANGNWQLATQAGGIYSDSGREITIDNAWNTYVTGSFEDTATFGSYSLASSGYYDDDIFVAKMDASGNWQWAIQASGVSGDKGYGITLDAAGNSYVTGFFYDTATFGSYSLTSSGSSDIFVAMMDASGIWQWATKAGGNNYDWGLGITTDDGRNSYVTGGFYGTATFGSYSLTSSGSWDIFVAKMDAGGNWLWATKAGGTDNDKGYGITLDAAGNSYVTGFFYDTATFGSHFITANGVADIFVAKLNSVVSTDPEINPDAGSLSNYPNPFNTSTMINYALKRETDVCLEVYNIKGQLVETLFEGSNQAGDHTLEWDCQNISAGIYFLKMRTGNEKSVRKMVLLR